MISFLDPVEVGAWARRCLSRARACFGGDALGLERERSILSSVEGLEVAVDRGDPWELEALVARLATSVEQAGVLESGWEVDALVEGLLGAGVSDAFRSAWREGAGSLTPIRLYTQLASFGARTVVHLDTEAGRERYCVRLDSERTEGLETFRTRLNRLRADPGALGIPELAPPVAAADLEDLEACCGGPLPEGYRRFLREVGSGGAGPNWILSPAEVRELLSGGGDPSLPFPWWDQSPGLFDAAPHGAIPVALGGHDRNVWTLLVTSGPERGRVWGAIRGRLRGRGSPARPIVRRDLADQVFVEGSLPLAGDEGPERLTFDAWFGEWLALYCAALPDP